MGNSSLTMNDLAQLIGDESVKDKCKKLSVDIRSNLDAIAGSCSRKEAAGCEELQRFVQIRKK